jgi:dethiobiotin synthetase
MRRLRYFITGTDTGVGKTIVSEGLLSAWRRRGLRVAGMKPIATGASWTPDGLRNPDAEVLRHACTDTPPYADVNPYAFEPPMAPHMALRRSGLSFSFDLVGAAMSRLEDRSDVLIVEGAGGWLAPLTETLALADLARVFRLPVILVVGLRLGCINHALLSAQAIARDGVLFAGWIANCVEPGYSETVDTVEFLRSRIAASYLGQIPWPATSDQGLGALDAAVTTLHNEALG